MGIVNVTPDSFSDGGRFGSEADAVEEAVRQLDDGADLVDVGGESTRPGSDAVPAEDERRRVLPVIEGVLGERPNAVVSVDTRRAIVAQGALDLGASVVNDTTAGRDPAMFETVRAAGSGLVLMHMQGEPKSMQDAPAYDDVVGEVTSFLRDRRDAAVAAGVAAEQLAIDPGIGFGKDVGHNLELLRSVGSLRALEVGLVVGASRKRFIGTLTGVEDPADRLDGSLAVAAWCAASGVDVVRVHDVGPTVRALQVVDAIAREGA